MGNGEYDVLRTPSWCDRILYKVVPETLNNDISVEHYSSNRQIKMSDHYPVSALFKLTDVMKPSREREKFWKCKFDNIPTWTSDIPFVCRFTLHGNFYTEFGSYADWIGLYPHKLQAISKPIRWVYLISCYRDDESKTIVEFQALSAGQYRMGYFSYYKNCLIGLSKPFLVESIETRSNGIEGVAARPIIRREGIN